MRPAGWLTASSCDCREWRVQGHRNRVAGAHLAVHPTTSTHPGAGQPPSRAEARGTSTAVRHLERWRDRRDRPLAGPQRRWQRGDAGRLRGARHRCRVRAAADGAGRGESRLLSPAIGPGGTGDPRSSKHSSARSRAATPQPQASSRTRESMLGLATRHKQGLREGAHLPRLRGCRRVIVLCRLRVDVR